MRTTTPKRSVVAKPDRITDGHEEMDGAYRLVQSDSGHWYAITPTDKESPIHWSKTAIRYWIQNHRKVGDRGTFV